PPTAARPIPRRAATARARAPCETRRSACRLHAAPDHRPRDPRPSLPDGAARSTTRRSRRGPGAALRPRRSTSYLDDHVERGGVDEHVLVGVELDALVVGRAGRAIDEVAHLLPLVAPHHGRYVV